MSEISKLRFGKCSTSRTVALFLLVQLRRHRYAQCKVVKVLYSLCSADLGVGEKFSKILNRTSQIGNMTTRKMQHTFPVFQVLLLRFSCVVGGWGSTPEIDPPVAFLQMA